MTIGVAPIVDSYSDSDSVTCAVRSVYVIVQAE
jgi:hypothetical protein